MELRLAGYMSLSSSNSKNKITAHPHVAAVVVENQNPVYIMLRWAWHVSVLMEKGLITIRPSAPLRPSACSCVAVTVAR